MWKSGNPWALLVGRYSVQTLWKTAWRFLRKLEAELASDPAVPLLGIRPKELKAGSQIPARPCSRQHCSQQPIRGSKDGWAGKPKVVYPHKGILSAWKGKEILTHVTTGMNPNDIVPSEIRQTQRHKKDKYYGTRLTGGTTAGRFIEAESRTAVSGAAVGVGLCSGQEGFHLGGKFWRRAEFWRRTALTSAQQWEHTSRRWTGHFKND